MPKKKPRPADEKPQRERFIETAREIGASDDPEEFERVFRAVIRADVEKNSKDTIKDPIG